MRTTTSFFSMIAGAMLASHFCIAQMQYPKTEKKEHTDTYHGTVVSDPYHWLEDDKSEETAAWVKAQNEATNTFFSQITYRKNLLARLEKLQNYERFGVPTRIGKALFYYRNDGLQNQSVLYKQVGVAEPQVFIDPNALSKEGTVSFSMSGISDDDKTIAFSVSKAGSDWSDVIFYDAESGKQLADTLHWVKFSGASFYKDGVYYSRYDAPTGSALSAKNEYQKVYFHKMGTAQSQDVLVYEDKANPMLYFGAGVTEDNQFLILTVSKGTSGNQIKVKNLKKGQKEFTVLCPGFANDHAVEATEGGRLIVRTNLNAPNYRLVSIDPANPDPKNWIDILPNKEDMVLQAVVPVGKTYFVSYQKDVTSRLFVYDIVSKAQKEVKLPGLGSVSGISARRKDASAYLVFTSFIYPASVFEAKPSGTLTLYKQPKVDFPIDDYTVKQEFYASKDGTKVPMFIVHKKGLEMNGKNPTLLYGYGGFNISVQPAFSTSRLVFLEQGGVLAVANIRGGGEYGEKWHKAGMLLKKQNVFDDFIAAAEYLQAAKYTSPNFTAIEGGSNGGLLVGACMTQRPDLFKVALPAVGVLDMLRYHKFTIGWGWAVEYGSSDSSKYFNYLKGYSPLHNLKPTNYPATLITTGDHDDRVVPAHSFKFAAALQENQKGNNPTLIRIETNAGHGAGKPIKKVLEERADVWAFLFWNMGYELLPVTIK
jgi:prolyl oligopeptidase